jgi:hypothetical protein
MSTTTQQIGNGLPLIREFMKFSNVEITPKGDNYFKVDFLTRLSYVPPTGEMSELGIHLVSMGVNPLDNTLFVLLRVD